MPRVLTKKGLLSAEEISEEFPLHMLVWYNNPETLNQKLTENKVYIVRFL